MNDQGPPRNSSIQSTTTVAPIEHELGDAVLEDRVDYPKLASPPADDRSDHTAGTVASADVNANTSDTDDDYDSDITQSDASDESRGSSDGTDPEAEVLEKEMGRYVPRTKPSKPAVGAQTSNPPRSQSKATNTAPQPSATKNGRLPAVTAAGKTTASRSK